MPVINSRAPIVEKELNDLYARLGVLGSKVRGSYNLNQNDFNSLIGSIRATYDDIQTTRAELKSMLDESARMSKRKKVK